MPKRATLVSGALLLLIAAAARAVFWAEPPGRDQSLFMAQAQAMARGRVLYGDIWEHKPPGTILAYWGAFHAFGERYAAVQALTLLATAATTLLLFRVLRGLGQGVVLAMVSAALYPIFASGVLFGGYWCTGQAEVLADPLLAFALVMLVCRQPWTVSAWAIAGVALGAMLLLKYSMLPIGVAAAIVGVERQPRRLRVRAAGVLAVASAAPLVVVALWAAASGALPGLWEATIDFNRAHRHIGAVPWSLGIVRRVCTFRFAQLAPLYGASLGGLAVVPRGPARRILSTGLLLWLGAALAVVWQQKLWVYHYHSLLLPLVVAASGGLLSIEQRLARHAPAWSTSLALVPIAPALLPYIARVNDYAGLHRLAGYYAGQVSRDELEATYRWGGLDYDFAETRAVAMELRARTRPGDSVFVWGFEPGIYFYSGRPCASRFFYDYPLMPEIGPLHDAHVQWLLEDLERTRPAAFVVVMNDANDLERATSWDQLQAEPRLLAFVARNYRPAWQMGDFRVFSLAADEQGR